jgi:hypothetical protein
LSNSAKEREKSLKGEDTGHRIQDTEGLPAGGLAN